MLVWQIPLLLFLLLAAYSGFPVLWTRVFHLSSYRRIRGGHVVALTFDDGPDPVYTPQLLNVLAEHGVKATFFVIAKRALAWPEVIERMRNEGHEVAIHGDRHLFVPFLSPRSTAHQCLGARNLIRETFGIEATAYRPPWGACNLATFWYLRRGAMTMCLWSIMVGDWRKTDPAVLTERVVEGLDDGAVIVLHDSSTYGAEAGAPANVIAAMPSMISAIRRKGYEFCLVSARP